MNRPSNRLLALAFAACALGNAACVTDGNDSVTCAYYDEFLFWCTSNCSPTWDCERNYNRMSLFRQDRLDECSDCLVANLDAGVCADCSIPSLGVPSCQLYLESLLGIDCW